MEGNFWAKLTEYLNMLFSFQRSSLKFSRYGAIYSRPYPANISTLFQRCLLVGWTWRPGTTANQR